MQIKFGGASVVRNLDLAAVYSTRRLGQRSGRDHDSQLHRLLETHGLAARMLEAVNAHLAHKDQSLRSGTIVDATLIAAPSSPKNADRAREAGIAANP